MKKIRYEKPRAVDMGSVAWTMLANGACESGAGGKGGCAFGNAARGQCETGQTPTAADCLTGIGPKNQALPGWVDPNLSPDFPGPAGGS